MVRKQQQRSKKWDSLKKMPPLHHKLPGEEYSNENSDVLRWIGQQLDVIDWIRDNARSNGLIIYNPKTGKWQGVEYEND